jgi:UDP-3-O-[3-hydroxymyristoyl] glucosamine N-acyltransferase
MGNKVTASQIADFLEVELYGHDNPVEQVSSLNKPNINSLVFAKKSNFSLPEDFKGLVIAPLAFNSQNYSFSFVKVKKPRLSFAKVVNHFFVNKKKEGISNSAAIGEGCQIDDSVYVGENCSIGNGVVIGKNSIINNNVVIADNTVIGCGCFMKSGSVIGENGFGFDFEDDGTPVKIPHIGKVVIGNNVEIGAKNTIARGTIDDTIIEDNVKTDDQVHIAHNCRIGKNTLITACAEISGSVEIGENCWIAPNCTIINKVKIGNKVVVGIGALIIKDLPDGSKFMGLEALELKNLKRLKKRLEYGEKH